MLKKVIKFEEVKAAFLAKNPNGVMWRDGEYSFVDDDGKETVVKGNQHKINVAYSEEGKVYTYKVNNNLELAHALKLMLDIGYAGIYYSLQETLRFAEEHLDHPDDRLFGFGSRSIDDLTRTYERAKSELELYESKYSVVA